MVLMKFLCLFLLAGPLALADCRPLVKIVGTVDVTKNRWVEAYRGKKPEKICVDTNSKNPTLELNFTKEKDSYSQRIFTSLIGYYDAIAKKKLSGGTYRPKHLTIHAWAPEWVNGSRLRISEIASKKLILEVQL